MRTLTAPLGAILAPGSPGIIAALCLAVGLIAAAAAPGVARDRIRIVGSSTMFPYGQAVAEQYARATHARAPVVEATGTGGGLKIFCGGVGAPFPDIVGASRPIAPPEYRDCASNGVGDITEVLIGYDGVSVAQSRDAPDLRLTRAQLFAALAREVEVAGAVVPNPFRRWNEIDPALPDRAITILGPPPTSGTRDAVVELVMHPGCAAYPAIAALDAPRREAVCSRVREDGAYVTTGEDDNLIARGELRIDPEAVGIVGFPVLYENREALSGVQIEGVAPGPTAISEGRYALSRPLYIYVKNANRRMIPGLEALIAEYISEDALGPEGYLRRRGLVPLDRIGRDEVRARVARGESLGPSN